MTATRQLAVLIAACLSAACLPSLCRADSAEQILAAAGVRGGLVVHVGCGDGKLTAALGARGPEKGDWSNLPGHRPEVGRGPEGASLKLDLSPFSGRPRHGYLVHGLDTNPENVATARAHIASLGACGRVAVDTFPGDCLPYVDNLAALVVSEDLGEVPTSEVMRVLRPGGVAYVKQGGAWKKTVKPRPAEIDEWTHFLHGPDNNAVARDSVVDVPRHVQWLGLPKFARAHEQLASLSACVTTAGRLFYIIDDSPRADVRFPSRWFLVARDAFSGVVLWKRPIPTWLDQFRRFRAGPPDTAFRLAAKDDLVYATLGADAPVSILDAATGRTLATCRETANARQILRIGDRLVVLIDTAPQTTAQNDSRIRRGLDPAPGTRSIAAFDAQSGNTLWRKKIDLFVHPTLAARGDRLFYQTNQNVCCLDLDNGSELWRAAAEMELTGHEAGWESPTLVAHDAAVYCADFKKIVALSAKDGAVLWRGPCRSGYNSPPDLFVTGGLVWLKAKGMRGLDPATGALKRELPTVHGYMHHRCYRNKATDRFFLLGDQGVQFVGLESGDARIHHWIRGTCQYGIMPANGLLYVTPDSCACNMKSKLAGFWALAPAPSSIQQEGPNRQACEKMGTGTSRQRDFAGPGATSSEPVPISSQARRGERLQKGPAYGKIDAGQSPPDADPGSWPVYRHDAARSGMTRAAVPAELKPAWRVKIGGRLSGVTAAGGKVFVAAVDTHTVYALDQRSGQQVWSFTAGGRIDTPPTIYRGTALFGSADGWVYAVRASDGELAWRFRAAPQDRRTFVNGQIESVWPVHGSVLVHEGRLAVAAGRSSYLDGGIRLYQLDPRSGRMLSETVMYSPDPETFNQPQDRNRLDVRGVLSDILLADGGGVYMRHVKLDFQTGDHTARGVHLFSPIGLLDDTWWHRAYWIVGDEFIAHWSGWWKVGNWLPSGRILSYDNNSVFGYGRDKYVGGNTGQWRGGERYRLFACDRPAPGQTPKPPAAEPARKKPTQKKASPKAKPKRKRPRQPAPPPLVNRWAVPLPFYVRAMVVAGDTLFVAGPPELTQAKGSGEAALALQDPEEALATWQGKKGAVLWAVSATDGRKLAHRQLDALPVFDGMAAAGGRLYMAMADGTLACWAAR